MDNIIKTKRLETEQAFTLHCFPDITCGSNRNIQVEKTPDECFRNINLLQNRPSSNNKNINEEMKKNVSENEKKAYIRGFMEGEKKGMESIKKKFTPVINHLKQALSEVEKIKKKIYRNAEKNTVDLAMAIAGKILCHEISTNEKVILNVVRKAIKKVVLYISLSLINLK